jgi:hypothetical protein
LQSAARVERALNHLNVIDAVAAMTGDSVVPGARQPSISARPNARSRRWHFLRRREHLCVCVAMPQQLLPLVTLLLR